MRTEKKWSCAQGGWVEEERVSTRRTLARYTRTRMFDSLFGKVGVHTRACVARRVRMHGGAPSI